MDVLGFTRSTIARFNSIVPVINDGKKLKFRETLTYKLLLSSTCFYESALENDKHFKNLNFLGIRLP